MPTKKTLTDADLFGDTSPQTRILSDEDLFGSTSSSAPPPAPKRQAAPQRREPVDVEKNRGSFLERAGSFFDDFQDATVSSAISGVTGLVEAVPAFGATAIDVMADTVTAGPVRRAVNAVRTGEPQQMPMVATDKVTKVFDKGRDAVRSAAGVDHLPLSVADTAARTLGGMADPLTPVVLGHGGKVKTAANASNLPPQAPVTALTPPEAPAAEAARARPLERPPDPSPPPDANEAQAAGQAPQGIVDSVESPAPTEKQLWDEAEAAIKYKGEWHKKGPDQAGHSALRQQLGIPDQPNWPGIEDSGWVLRGETITINDLEATQGSLVEALARKKAQRATPHDAAPEPSIAPEAPSAATVADDVAPTPETPDVPPAVADEAVQSAPVAEAAADPGVVRRQIGGEWKTGTLDPEGNLVTKDGRNLGKPDPEPEKEVFVPESERDRVGFWRTHLEPVLHVLDNGKLGETGKVIGRTMRAIDGYARSSAAPAVRTLGAAKMLSKDQVANLIGVLYGKEDAKDMAVSMVARNIRKDLDDVAERTAAAKIQTTDADGTVRDFQPLKDYLPKIVDFDETGAPRLINEVAGHFTGNLQKSRRPGSSSRDITPEEFIRVMTRYYEGANRTIGEAKYLGDGAAFTPGKVEAKLHEWMKSAAKEGVDDEYIQNEVGRMFGKERHAVGSKERTAASKILQFETAAKLGLAVFSNAQQIANVFAKTGFKNTGRALAEWAAEIVPQTARKVGDKLRGKGQEERVKGFLKTKEDFDAFYKSGAGLDTLSRELADGMESTGLGKLAHNILKVSFFTAVEKFNRIIAAKAGMHYADDLAKSVNSGGRFSQKLAIRDLGKLLDVDADTAKAIAARGLTEDEKLTVARRISDITQFSAAKETLPASWSRSPYAKVFFQFKSFALKQSYFLTDEVIKPLLRDGNPAPLTRYLGTGTGLAVGSSYVKDLVTGRDRSDESTLERAVSAGLTMMMLDTVGRMVGGVGKGDLMSLLPPAASDLAQIGTAVGRTAREVYEGEDVDWEDRLRSAARVVPPLRAITNRTIDQ